MDEQKPTRTATRDRCVLFLIDRMRPTLAGVSDAQTMALEKQLPMAVVCCVPDQDAEQLNRLLPFELELAAYNIPLIVLIGQAEKTLAGIVHHTSPVKIFESVGAGSVELVVHSHRWHGTVISVDEIAKLETIC